MAYRRFAVVEVKYCGLMREEDAAYVASLGARFAGTIFAGGPRELSPDRARLVHAASGGSLQRVGVFGADFRTRIAEVLAVVPLDVIQLHADPTAVDVRDARSAFGGMVWAVVRVAGGDLPAHTAALFGVADGVLLDAKAPSGLGGSGVALPWAQIARVLGPIRQGGRLILAGGLRPENVGDAVDALSPDIVDVSSGVESALGIKDRARMLAFFRAATGRPG